MKILITTIIIFMFQGCSGPTPADPDFSKYWQGDISQDYAWRYKLEKKIKQQLAEKGLVETIDEPDVIIYTLIGTWNKEDGYWWISKRPAKWLQNTVFIQKNGQISGKWEFHPAFRRVIWFFAWSEKQPKQALIFLNDFTKNFKKDLYLKFD